MANFAPIQALAPSQALPQWGSLSVSSTAMRQPPDHSAYRGDDYPTGPNLDAGVWQTHLMTGAV